METSEGEASQTTNLIRQGEEGIKQLTKSIAKEITDEEFDTFAFDLKVVVANLFPDIPAVVRFKKGKLSNGSFKFAVKRWL